MGVNANPDNVKACLSTVGQILKGQLASVMVLHSVSEFVTSKQGINTLQD